ncbi:Secretory immunoglobulin A-binding protein EsiB [Pelomyxa schiedti]|nr:Secretory immunoglobulin A-binding protein EsiB [Pelomyxa schiedti]
MLDEWLLPPHALVPIGGTISDTKTLFPSNFRAGGVQETAREWSCADVVAELGLYVTSNPPALAYAMTIMGREPALALLFYTYDSYGTGVEEANKVYNKINLCLLSHDWQVEATQQNELRSAWLHFVFHLESALCSLDVWKENNGVVYKCVFPSVMPPNGSFVVGTKLVWHCFTTCTTTHDSGQLSAQPPKNGIIFVISCSHARLLSQLGRPRSSVLLAPCTLLITSVSHNSQSGALVVGLREIDDTYPGLPTQSSIPPTQSCSQGPMMGVGCCEDTELLSLQAMQLYGEGKLEECYQICMSLYGTSTLRSYNLVAILLMQSMCGYRPSLFPEEGRETTKSMWQKQIQTCSPLVLQNTTSIMERAASPLLPLACMPIPSPTTTAKSAAINAINVDSSNQPPLELTTELVIAKVAVLLLARMHYFGAGNSPVNLPQAVWLLSIAILYRDPATQNFLGFFLYQGEGMEKDTASAVGLYRIAASQGHAGAQCNLGICYENGDGGLKRDTTEAVKWYTMAAAQGLAEAECCLGVCHESGSGGLVKDVVEAVRLYRAAVLQGHPRAQCNLGFCYERGKGGLQVDDNEAVRLYTLSANQGHPRAQNNLGLCYEYGKGGLPKSTADAVRLYRLAADHSHPWAQRNLGICYENGEGGLPCNIREAVKLYRLAASQGLAAAYYSIGVTHEAGKGGVVKDLREASRFYKLAADEGYAGAKDRVKRLLLESV